MVHTQSRIALVVSAVLLFTLSAFGELVQQNNAKADGNRVLASGTLSELAIFLANNGMSAGVIARSPATTSVVPPTDRGQRATEWLNERRLTPDDLLVPPGESVTARDALLRFSSAHHGPLHVRSADLVPVIADEGAVACQRILQSRVTAEVSARDIGEAMADVLNASSPGSAVRGWVGSCLSVGSDTNRTPMGIDGSLENGLNQLAARVHGAVWYAVDNGFGGCSLGLIAKRAQGTGSCHVMLATDVR